MSASERPMDAMGKVLRGRTSFHMPGHKGKPPFEPWDAYAYDTTELPLTDDLYAPSGPIAKAEALAAKAAGSRNTRMLHGGATAGIHAMLLYSAAPGDEVILPRNAHHSAIHACVIGGLQPVFVPVTMGPQGYAFVSEDSVLEAMNRHPRAKAVFVTRPDYYGGALSMTRIVANAHARGMLVLVDEAHGAHWNWMRDIATEHTIETAGALGVDMWVQSAHKTLPCLTAGAWLHLGPDVDGERVRRILRMIQTSSPSFPGLKALDDARAWMDERGREALERLLQRTALLRKSLAVMGYGDGHDLWRGLPLRFDPTRLVISAPQGGYGLESALRGYGIDVECADHHRVVCIATVMNTDDDFAALEHALGSIPPESRDIPQFDNTLPMGEWVMAPREAALGAQQAFPPHDAVGRIAAACAGLYPPGIPLVVPGERITPEVISVMEEAPKASRFGLAEGQYLCVAERK